MEVRAGKWERSIVCCLMAAILLVPASSALAGTGNDVSQSGSNYTANTGGGGGNYTGSYALYDGGVKVSFLLTSADGESHYKPEKSEEEPLLKRQTPTGLASSTVPKGYKDGANLGYYGIGSIYFTNTANKVEYERGIYIDEKGSFSFEKSQKSVKRVTESDIKEAYGKVKKAYGYELSQKSNNGKIVIKDYKALYNALKPNSTFKMMKAFDSTFLDFGIQGFETNEEYLANPDVTSHNKAVLATLLQVMIDKYGEKSDAGKIIKECGLETMADIDNSQYRFAVLIESALEIYDSSKYVGIENTHLCI